MGFASTKLWQAVTGEQKSFQKKAKKKSLWGSIGRTIGGLGVMALTGGAVNPVTLGLLTGAASFLGGAAGAKAAGGKLTGGRFFQEDRESAQKELGAFGTQNLMSSLKSGLQAGFGQALKLQKPGAPKVAKGLDFEGSFVGKGLEKERAARQLAKARNLQVGEGLVPTGQGDMIGTGTLPRGKGGVPDLDKLFAEELEAGQELKKARKTVTLGDAYDVDEEFGFDDWTAESPVYQSGQEPGLSTVGKDWATPPPKPLSSTLDWREADVKQFNQYGSATGGTQHFGTGSGQSVAQELGDKFYEENLFGVGDKAGEVIPISEATPRALRYGDQTVTGTYGSREAGEYLFEDKPKESMWDKLWGELGPTSMEDRLLQDQMRKAKGLHSFEAFYNQGNANQSGMSTVIGGK